LNVFSRARHGLSLENETKSIQNVRKIHSRRSARSRRKLSSLPSLHYIGGHKKEFFMNKLLVLASLLLASTSAQAADAAPTRIALINMQEAIRGTAEGKKAEATLRKEMEDLQKKMQTEGKKIQDSMENLRKQGMVMDEKTRREKEEAIQKQIVGLREEEAKNTQKFQERDQQISQPIIKKLREVVATLAKEKNYTLVMDGGSVIYAQAGDDITSEVIKRYDSKK